MQQTAGHESIEKAHGIRSRSDQEAVINPAGMISVPVAPCDAVEVATSLDQPDRTNIKRAENKRLQRLADTGMGGLLDNLANEQITNVGVAPAFAWREVEGIGNDPSEQFVHHPGLVAPLDSLMIRFEPAVFGNTGTVLQYLAKRVGSAGQRLVERQSTLCDELKRARGDCGFSEAPLGEEECRTIVQYQVSAVFDLCPEDDPVVHSAHPGWCVEVGFELEAVVSMEEHESLPHGDKCMDPMHARD